MTGDLDNPKVLMLLGEMMGDIKTIKKNQEEFRDDTRALEDRIVIRITAVGARVDSLETYKTKATGFILALSLIFGALSNKIAHALGIS